MRKVTNELKKNYLDKLDKVKIKFLKSYNIKQMLFNESQYVLITDQGNLIKLSLKNALLSIFSIRNKIYISSVGSKLLTITEVYNRVDHDTYWKNIKDLFIDKDEIIIGKYKDRQERRKNIDIKNIIPNFILFVSLIFAFRIYKNLGHRLYLASQCLEQCVALKKVMSCNLRPKVEMCFFDGGFYENILVQYFNNIGSKTITNQHGQPVYRGDNFDLIDQSQILNFKSDYYLAKGEITRKQFRLAGLQDEKILIVGDINTGVNIPLVHAKTFIFCVFLDCITFESAKSDNSSMLELAKDFANKTEYKYYIKIHPTDIMSKYFNINDSNCLGIMDKNIKLEDIAGRVDFSISNCSAVYIDMLRLGVKPFKIQTKTNFPIVNNQNDIINNSLELGNRVKEWLEKSREEKNHYFIYEYSMYSSTESTKDRIKDIIDKIIDC